MRGSLTEPSGYQKLKLSDILIGIALFCTLFLAGEYRIIGYVGFAMLFGMHFILLTLEQRWYLKLNSRLTISILLNIAYLSILLFINLFLQRIYENTIYSFLMQIMIYLYLLVLTGRRVSAHEALNISRVYSYLFIIILFYLYIKDIELLNYSNYFESQLGFLVLVSVCFFILSKKNIRLTLPILAVTGVTIYLSSRRGALLGLIGFLITYFFWNVLRKSLRLYKFYFIVISIICILVPFIYLELSNPNSSLGIALNSLVVKLTGSRLFSGRDILWPYVIEIIMQNPLIGSGIGVTLSEFFQEINLSTHNLAFFVLMQSGLVGLFLFYYMLYCFWLEYFKNDPRYSRIFGSLLIAIIIQQTFSLGLLSGKMALAIPVWTLISFGVYNFINTAEKRTMKN